MQHSGQIFSFVQRSRGVVSHALIRSQFVVILTNQVPSLCLLPRFAAKLRPFLTVLTNLDTTAITPASIMTLVRIRPIRDLIGCSKRGFSVKLRHNLHKLTSPISLIPEQRDRERNCFKQMSEK